MNQQLEFIDGTEKISIGQSHCCNPQKESPEFLRSFLTQPVEENIYNRNGNVFQDQHQPSFDPVEKYYR